MSRGTILIVEDEAIVAADLGAKLNHLGYQVIGSTGRGEEAITLARDWQPDIILMDIHLQGELDGVEAAASIHKSYALPCIYLTAHSDAASIQRAKTSDCFGYILKPFEERELEIAIEMGLYKHRSEARLRESEERCRALADASFDGVVILEQSRVVFANARFLEMLGLGREEVSGQEISELVGEELGTAATQSLDSGSNESHESCLARRDGGPLLVELRTRSAQFQGRPVRVASIRDVTEPKRMEAARLKLEAQLRQSQKMQVLGTLAGGIAHDFNNVLTIILGNSELVRTELPPGHGCRELLMQVIKAAYRGRDLVDQILTFSRPREQRHSVVQLGSVVEETVKLLRATLPSTIKIGSAVPLTGCRVVGDAGQIQQVLINVGSNAGHAMRAKGGVLNMRHSFVQVKESRFDVLPELGPGRYVRLDVSDTGCGMAPGIMERIFEPFFTTRPPGEGTGLGLAVTLGILQGHSGGISVESEPGKGSTFHLYFPAAADDVTEPVDMAEPAPGARRGRGERVVVVDDEGDIAELVSRTLTRGGYEASVFTNPREALSAIREDPGAYDLVLTDLTMPGMTGQELARQIHQIRPGMPVVLCTGFGDDLDGVALNEAGIEARIAKPFSVQALYDVLDRVLPAKPL